MHGDVHAAATSGAGDGVGTAARVFLSHATTDAAAARAVCDALEASGRSCWIAPRDIRAGREWGQEIIAGIDASSAMIVLVTASSNASRQVAREVERADSRGMPLVPVRLGAVQPGGALEFFLSHYQWIDASRPPLAERVPDIVRALADLMGERTTTAPTTPVASAPRHEVAPDDWDRKPGGGGWLRRLLEDR